MRARATEQTRAAIRTAVERLVISLPPERQAEGLAILGECYDAARGDRWVLWSRWLEGLQRAA